jgi:uncharacterized protein (UPF0548 family)
MFRLVRASERQKKALIAQAQLAPSASPQLLTLANGPVGTPPRGFAHDISRTRIGRGLRAFAEARTAFQRWEQFDLGWACIANGAPRLAPGELVAVESCTAWLWAISINRIIEVVDTPTRFGFLYATTSIHVEEGQERFIIERDSQGETVSYLIEAISRPRAMLARIGYPFTRAMQHRFARDSRARLARTVHDRT